MKIFKDKIERLDELFIKKLIIKNLTLEDRLSIYVSESDNEIDVSTIIEYERLLAKVGSQHKFGFSYIRDKYHLYNILLKNGYTIREIIKLDKKVENDEG